MNSDVTSADALNESTKDPTGNTESGKSMISFSASGRDRARASKEINHKSFDFSDIGLYGEPADYNFRKFHQTAIFISNPAADSIFENGQHEKAYSKAVITSNLPETLSYSLNSQWENPLNFGSGLFNLGTQLFGGSRVPSGVTRVTSFRIWKGTEPMKLVIDIPVIDDSYNKSKTNLNEALEVISSLVLPRYRNDSKNYGFYDPPPSPLAMTYTFDGKNKHQLKNTQNARTMVQIGGILLLDHCIIEKVDVTYPNTKALIRHDYTNVDKGEGFDYGNTRKEFLYPLLANIKITVSTIEALTYDTYYKMIWGKAQQSGELTLDLSWLKKIRTAAYSFMGGEDLGKIIEDWKKPVKNPTEEVITE